jgi:hypothetical protein
MEIYGSLGCTAMDRNRTSDGGVPTLGQGRFPFLFPQQDDEQSLRLVLYVTVRSNTPSTIGIDPTGKPTGKQSTTIVP